MVFFGHSDSMTPLARDLIALVTLLFPATTLLVTDPDSRPRFLVGDKLPDDESDYGYKWYIPFTYVDQDGTSDIIWMEPDATDGLRVNHELLTVLLSKFKKTSS